MRGSCLVTRAWRRHRSLEDRAGSRPRAILAFAWLLPLVLLASASTARATASLGFLEFHQNNVDGVSGLAEAEAVAVSPDGAHVYAAGSASDAIAIFDRDPTAGSLHFKAAVRNDDPAVSKLNRPRAVAVSPDGAHVYAAAFTDDAVVVFSRDGGTGLLTFVEALQNGEAGLSTLDGPDGLAVSPDGGHVYVVSARSNSLTVFERDVTTGELSLVEAHVDGAGGISSLAGAETVVVSPDGQHVYVAAQDDDAVTVFERTPATGALTPVDVEKDGEGGVDGLNWVQGVAVSADGRHVYTASAADNAVTVFSRDASSGVLTFVEVERDGEGSVDGLEGAEWVAVSTSDKYVYAVSDVENALVVFHRDSTTGELSFANVLRDIAPIDGLGGATNVVTAPGQVYVAAITDSGVSAFEELCGNGQFDPGEECDDGNTDDWDCCSSSCTAEPPGTICMDDGNVCTDDKCNGAGLCLHVNNTAPCDDGLFCTVGDTCLNRECQGAARDCSGVTSEPCMEGVCDDTADACAAQPKAAGAACDDGELCTQMDTCLGGTCVGGSPVVCAPINGCHDAGVCDPATGACSNPVRPDGSACDDGNGCTLTDTCLSGVCTGADPVACTALDQCHAVGTCDPATGACSNPPVADGTGCDDGSACTRSDTCESGVCVGADPVVCTALDQCHAVGTCDAGTGVCPNPERADGTACDDGNACTQSDTCESGVCVGADPVVCAALDQCHAVGTCDPGTGACTAPAVADGTACDDGNACTQSDACESGVCVGADPVVCTALDQCHAVGTCDPGTGACTTPAVADGTACDDGNACTRSDTCEGGGCVGADPVVCTALDQCHAVGTCDAATGICTHPAVADGTACDDGDACTRSDTCEGGVCVGADPVVCTAADQCHEGGTCDPATGLCSGPTRPDGTVCDDGDACTRSDTCESGVCVGADPVVCTAADQCHEGGTCDPATGLCSGPIRPDGVACDDGNACTQSDTCESGVCIGADPVVCAALDQCHAVGTCDAGTGACSTPAVADGVACDDGNACTQSDTCESGVCVGADPVACTAADQCHVVGTCDPGTGACTTPAVADGTACDDGNACTQSDTCEGGGCVGADPVACVALDQCHAAGTCDAATGICTHPAVADGTACDDGDACTRSDTCESGVCVGADPVVCTAPDSCLTPGVCDAATGACSAPTPVVDGAACDDGNACTQSDACASGVCVGADPVVCVALDQCHAVGTCDTGTGVCSNPEVLDGTACDDGNACTQSDACASGVCVGADPVVCVALDQCHEIGACDPVTGVCMHPARPDGSPCDDGTACTRADACASGVCVGADPVVCTALDQCHAVGVCDPVTGQCPDPAHADDGTPCDDGSACTRSDSCSGGVCVGADPVVCAALDQCHAVGVCDPATGVCSDPPRADGAPCNDGDACTQTDACTAGVCVGADPVVCSAGECHDALCDPATGTCSSPPAADGTVCDDGSACTRTDTCQSGVCVGGDPVICVPIDQCHAAGTCDPANGLCSTPAWPDTITFSFDAIADVHTNEAEPATNFGTSSSLQLDGRPDRHIYLRFEVTGLGEGAEGSRIAAAAIRMTVAGDTNAGSDDGGSAHALSDVTWDELTITHDNRPAIEGPALGGAGRIDPDDVVEFDVGPAISGDGVYGFAILPGSNNMGIYRSREAGAGGPELIVRVSRSCDDGNACTQSDTCEAGRCVGADPVACPAPTQCHEIGACEPATGLCSNPDAADGTPCDDGDACTQADSCVGGECRGGDPVVCSAGLCTAAGDCDSATGRCSTPVVADGTACDDGLFCTAGDACRAGTCRGEPRDCSHLSSQCGTGTCDETTAACVRVAGAEGEACDDGAFCTVGDTCQGGVCQGSLRQCPAADQCRGGICDERADVCTAGAVIDGTVCDDGDRCTRSDVCTGGTCVGGDPVVCVALDQCHAAGTCDPVSGLCSNPVKADGTTCDDGDACSDPDLCVTGMCVGAPLPDEDADGICDPLDLCPFMADPAQLDADADGVGDYCQCTAPAPGRCVAGGGNRRTDCLLEFTTTGPVTLNRRGTKVKPLFSCEDGDPACDLDGTRDGQCLFGVALCFANADPRLPRCAPSMVQSIEVLQPKVSKSGAGDRQANALALEQALAALGMEVRRRGQVVAEASSPVGHSQCSPLVRLAVPAGKKPKRQKFKLRVEASNRRRDTDRFALRCR